MAAVTLRSSHLVSADYQDGVLEIAFKDGGVYRYEVPQDVAAGLLKAPSPGKYLKEVIMPRYGHRKIA